MNRVSDQITLQMKIIKQHGNISRRFQINTVQSQTNFNDHAKKIIIQFIRSHSGKHVNNDMSTMD